MIIKLHLLLKEHTSFFLNQCKIKYLPNIAIIVNELEIYIIQRDARLVRNIDFGIMISEFEIHLQ